MKLLQRAAWVWSFPLGLVAVATASVAHGEDRNPAVAEVLFREGQRLLAAGDLVAACGKLSESERLDPQTGTLLNLALCHEKQGRTATAWSEYAEVASQAGRKGERDRERFARARASDTEKTLSRVALEVPAGVTAVEIDGQALGEAGWSLPLPLDPGEHAFVFSASGKKARVVHLVLPPGPASTRVAPPPLDDETGGAAPVPPAAHPVVSPPPPPPPPADRPRPAPVHEQAVTVPAPAESGGSERSAAFVIGGVGVAGLVTGGVFGVLAIAKKNEVNMNCTGRECGQPGFDAQSSARTFATVSTIAFAAGAVGAGVGIYLLFRAGSSSPKRAVRVVPAAAGNAPVLRLEGSF
jgi:hypothetical protein